MSKVSLYGFNNLTKSLSFSLYRLHYVGDGIAYQDYINTTFNADKLNRLLTKICDVIGGNILNIAKQDYQPHGASVTLMISEEAQPSGSNLTHAHSHVAHLDKSHLCIHTYPDDAPQEDIAIFRADIELSTCGVISPLKVLSFVIEAFNADVVDIDYRVRGMTRNTHGTKIFTIDHLNQLSDFLSSGIKDNFNLDEHSVKNKNIFHTRLARKKVILDNHLFGISDSHLTKTEKNTLSKQISHEIRQLFFHSE